MKQMGKIIVLAVIILILAGFLWVLYMGGAVTVPYNGPVVSAFAGKCRSSTGQASLVPSSIPAESSAAGFVSANAVHPTLIFTTSGKMYRSGDGIGGEWNPQSIAQVEVIACVSDKTKRMSFTYDQYLYTDLAGRQVGVYDARTGQKINSFMHPVHLTESDGTIITNDSLQRVASQIKSILRQYTPPENSD